MLTLELLGPVALRRDGVALPVTVKKTQALLLLLALGGAMPRERIAALLWPRQDEPSARRNLRRELARLRDAGLSDTVRAEADRLAPGATLLTDAMSFDAALAAGRPDDALVLWRAAPAEGLHLEDAADFNDWLALERERLQGGRLRALEASARALEARGDLAGALRRVETLLADDPLREQHHRDAMRLLAANGRREAALAQYALCRDLLQRELGLQPMAETEALRAQLRGAAAADPLPPAVDAARPAMSLPAMLPFVGRQAEVALLEAAWLAGGAVLIEGEGGVGKTRLALDFIAAHGPCALARCRPGDAEVPYASFTRALRALAGPAPVGDGLAGWVVAELARLLPELAPQPRQPIGSAEERNRFYEACAQGWLAWAGDNFDAVVLDDWQHADDASQALLVFVAQRRREAGAQGAREWVLMRPEPRSDALHRLCDGLQAIHLLLPPLDDGAVFELVRRLSGASRPARFAQRLWLATGGNPFFVAETLRHLAETRLLAAGEDGVWRTPFDDGQRDYQEMPVPPSVRAAVQARVQRLPPAARRILEAAALAGEPFLPALLAPACAVSELDAVLAIELAIEAQLLREHEAGGYAFAHDLVQQALDAALPAERRRLVHRRLALGAQAAQAPPAVIARHHEASGDAARAAPFRLAAGDQARRLHLLAEAVQHWRTGLAGQPAPALQMALRLRLMQVTRALNDDMSSSGHATALQALAEGGLLDAGERLDTWLAVARHFAQADDAEQALALLERLPPGLDEGRHADALVTRVHAMFQLGRAEAADLAAHEALALPGLRGRARADLLDVLVMVDHQAGRLQTALDRAAESVAICTRIGHEPGVARGLYRRGMLLPEAGDLQGAEAELRRGIEVCRRLGLASNLASLLLGLCHLYQRMDRPADQLAAAREGWATLDERASGLQRVLLRASLAQAHAALGELGAAWEHAEPMADELRALTAPQRARAGDHVDRDLFGLLGEQACVAALPVEPPAETDSPAARALRELAQRVALETAAGALGAATREAAVAALSQAGAPAIAALRLHRALAAAARAGAAGVPPRATQDCAAFVARLTVSLQAHPVQQAAFLHLAAV